MHTPAIASLNRGSRHAIVSIAATFLWADLEMHDTERDFLSALARELDVDLDPDLLQRPPAPEDVDPSRVDPRAANAVRSAALRAIASDGRVAPSEMRLFDLLDELLPRGDDARGGPV